MSFNAALSEVGKTEHVSLYASDSVPVVGDDKQDALGDWVKLASIVVHAIGQVRVDFTITDGGEFDADGTASGVIVDPGGLGSADRPDFALADKVLALDVADLDEAPDAQGLQFRLNAAQNG